MDNIDELINNICKDPSDKITKETIYVGGHLPSYAIYPDNFPSEKKVPVKETAEFYYELLDKEKNKNNNSKGDKNGKKGNSKNNGNTLPNLDDHALWEQIEGDTTLQKELTKNMVEHAANNAQKQRGNLPQNYAQIIENLTINREVNWKQVLRSIVGNKKANQRKTLMRRDRRLPHADWLKGKQKDRIFTLGVISDVSGSVSDSALKTLWGEIIHICQLFETPVHIVQVDTDTYPPTTLDKHTKIIERKAHGGTYLTPGIQAFTDANQKIDAFVITTDGYLCTEDVNNFAQIKKPVIWLIEENGQIMSNMNEGKMRAIKLSGDKNENK